MSDDIKARAQLMLLEAQEHEAAGNMMEAVECYKAAFKLCPELEKELAPKKEDDDPEIPYTRMPPADSGFRTFRASELNSPEGAMSMFNFLDEEGYLVIDDALSPQEVSTAIFHWENFMECTGIDVKTADGLRARLADSQVGICGKMGAGHSTMNWFVRSRENVKKGFALALGAEGWRDQNPEEGSSTEKEKLITSFDGFNYFRNPETDPQWQGITTSWMHFDAGHKDHARYVQGIVNLLDCTGEQDAGLVLWPKSHKTCFPFCVPQEPEYPAFLTYMGNIEWMKVRDRGVKERPFRVPLKAGSLVMWKSSVMHCNSACLPRGMGNGFDPTQLLRRLAVYVCMCKDPRKLELTEQRLRYFNQGRTCCHQPDIMRGVGDSAASEFVTAGAVVTSVDQLDALAPGGSELL